MYPTSISFFGILSFSVALPSSSHFLMCLNVSDINLHSSWNASPKLQSSDITVSHDILPLHHLSRKMLHAWDWVGSIKTGVLCMRGLNLLIIMSWMLGDFSGCLQREKAKPGDYTLTPSFLPIEERNSTYRVPHLSETIRHESRHNCHTLSSLRF